MGRGISVLTTEGIRDILGICYVKAGELIDSEELEGYRSGTKGRRVNLEDLIKFIDKHKFPRTRLLRFIEEHGATKEELDRYGITEPIGTGNIRFYPEIPPRLERPDILSTGEVASLLNLNSAIRTVSKGCDKGVLDCCRLPGEKTDRRITVDALARYFIKEGNYIPSKLEGRSFLLIRYPGGWEESQKVVYVPDTDTSVWYRDNENVQEVSVRCRNDGLYVKLVECICSLILLGITGREESNRIVHRDHMQRIAVYLTEGFNSLAKAGGSKKAQKTKEVLEYAMSQFDAYLTGKS